MATILLVDDNAATRNKTAVALLSLRDPTGAAIHQVSAPADGDRAEDFEAFLEGQFQANPGMVWDFLVLDVQFTNDLYGGIWLYNRLVTCGHRRRWRHTIIYSRHVPGDLDLATDGIGLIMRVFKDTSGIPKPCFVNSATGKHQKLLELIAHLANQP